MKTLADFKRALTVDSKWQATYMPTLCDLGIRKVASKKSNSVAFENEEGKISWLQFPKATEFNINEKGEVEIYWPSDGYNDKKLVLIYRKLV